MLSEEKYVEEIIDQDDNFSMWYNQVVRKAELADYAPVRGCMIIRPYGYAIWENVQHFLDTRFKETGALNAYFPLLIPRSFLEREAEHVEGFAPELAWVTRGGGEELEEPLAIRPTSETIVGYSFAKVFEIEYLDADGQRKNCATTSWGLSTRVIGAIIMVHGDKSGLILPPRVAPYQVVIVPIWRKEADKVAVNELVTRIEKMLKGKVRVKVDLSDNTPGWKFNEWEMRGVPVRMEIGPRDVQNNSVVLVRRDNRAKEIVSLDALEERLPMLLEEVQQALFQRALEFREKNTYYTDSYEEFKQIIAEKRGFVRVKWAEDSEAELAIKEETKATLRVIPFDQPEGGVQGKCFYTGKPATCEAIFARAY